MSCGFNKELILVRMGREKRNGYFILVKLTRRRIENGLENIKKDQSIVIAKVYFSKKLIKSYSFCARGRRWN